MGKLCVLKACPHRNLKNTSNISIRRHTFPKDSDLKKRWEMFVQKCNCTPFTSYTGALICSEHFEKSCYIGSKKSRLKTDAEPSIEPQFTAKIAFKFGLISSVNSPLEVNHSNDTSGIPSQDIASADKNNLNNMVIPISAESEPEAGVTEPCRQSSVDKGFRVSPHAKPIVGSSAELTPDSGSVVLDDSEQLHSDSSVDASDRRSLEHLPSTSMEFHIPKETSKLQSRLDSSPSMCSMCCGSVETSSGVGLPASPGSCDTNISQDQNEITHSTRKRTRKTRYFGDISPADFESPKQRIRSWNLVQKCVKRTRHKLKIAQQKLRRYKSKLQNIFAHVQHLKKQELISDEVARTLESKCIDTDHLTALK